MSADAEPRDPPVAIVGMGCLFPGAPDLVTYWQNIVAGRVVITEVPEGHSWSPSDHYDPDPTVPDKTWATRGGFVPPTPFDPLQHGVPPAMLESVDTTQLLSLIVAREALRDAGLDPDGGAWDRSRVSVILGVTGPQELAIAAGSRLQGPAWRRAMVRCGVDPALAEVVVRDIANHLPTWTEQTFPGLLGNVVAGRITNRLDLGGTNAVVDAACASSLAAVQFAVTELAAGRSDVVLTGGADTLNDAFMFQCFTRTPALSKRGQVRPFDAEADGILIGEGIAILAMKRLADAERDGDRVYAVLRGLGSSSDGRHKSIYAPNPDGQAVALRRAYARAGFGPDTVELVEAHGTGTRAGDSAEIEALSRVFSHSGRTGRWAAIGSVKAQIGHTKGTAGAAGLVKAALALQQRVLPPSAGVERPNPRMGFDRGPLYLSPRARPWIRAGDHPRRAAVSAFGFGGSNFHLVLEEHAGSEAAAGLAAAQLVLVGGPTHEAVITQLRALCASADPVRAARDALAAWTPGAEHVVALLVTDDLPLQARIDRAIARLGGDPARPGDEVWIGGGPPAPCAWVFPGQGSQYVELGRTLALRWAPVRAAFDAADEAFRSAGLPPLSSRTFPPPAWTEGEARAQAEALRATEWAQPAIGALSKGMADLLAAFGLRPDVVAGHSYGELVALHVAGVYDAEALWTLSRERGRLMSAAGRDRGAMLAVEGPLERIAAAIDGCGDVVLANRNHPEQGVIAGSASALDEARARLAAAGLSTRPLPVAAAFHSPHVADARAPLRAVLDGIALAAPSVPAVSCVDGAPWPEDPGAVADALADQLVRPVDWVAAVEALWGRGVRTFVEVGPRGVLAGLIERCLGARSGAAIALDRLGDREDGDTQLKRALAALAAAGQPVDPAPLLAERPPAPPRAEGPATVWLAGANHRNPETLDPPMPKPPPQPAPADEGWGAVPTSSRPMTPPSSWSAGAPPPGVGATDLAALLDSTRATLAAFQDAQARTAEVHGRFLDAVARANDNFARLFEAQARLVERLAGSGASHAEPPPAAAPPPAEAPVERVAAPTYGRPAVASDLPPVFDAKAALDGRLPQPSTARPGQVQAPARGAVEQAVLQAVATKTGYPREALQLAMELERDLGVDSIKRVEILTAVREAVPGAPDLDNERLSALRSLSDVVRALSAGPRPATVGGGRERVSSAVLDAVAAKTGYPRDALQLAMELERDLGVDSIKRVEILTAVRERVPEAPELDHERLSAVRSLADVVDALAEGASGSAAPAVPGILAPRVAPSREAVNRALLDAVADKTGFPRASLEVGMDLERDLGVDSIKRVEILTAVRERLPGLPELDTDTLGAARRVGELGEALLSVANGLGFALIGGAAAEVDGHGPTLLVPPAEPPRARSAAAAAAEAGLPPVQSASEMLAALEASTPSAGPDVPLEPGRSGPPRLRRRPVAVVPAPPRRGFPASGPWVITADVGGALAAAVTAALGRRGIRAVVVDPDWEAPLVLPEGVRGAVHLAAVGASGEDLGRRVRGGFALARALARGGAARRFVTVSACGGRFGRDGGASPSGALAGLAKTVAREWPDCRALALDIAPDESVDAEAIAAELVGDRGVIEVGLTPARAWTLADGPVPLDGPGELPLDPGDLVIVSGGGRGVTAAAVIALASRVPVSVLLLGRTAADDEPGWAAGVPDADLVRAWLGAAEPGAAPRQAEVAAARVRAGREIRATLAALHQAGAEAAHVAVDARDPQAVRDAVAAAEARFGPARALIHGAGVLADRRIADKSDDDFARVWSTKVDVLEALIGAVDPAGLRLCCAFTSVSGRYGNPGQADYAMANEAVVQRLLTLAAAAPSVRVKAFDWGPWDGGMVTPTVRARFEEQGQQVIPIEAGAAAFVDELGERDAVEVVLEAPLPRSGVAARRLAGDARWLQDHRIGGRAVVPVAMVVEWLAALGAEIAPGAPVAVRDVEVLKGIQAADGEDPELTLVWSPAPGRPDRIAVEILGAVAGSDDSPLGPPRLYRGALEIGAATPVAPPPALDALTTEAFPASRAEIYGSQLFHGPAYQALDELVGISGAGAAAWIRTSTPSDLGVPAASWHTDPVALDAVFQLGCLWVRHRLGSGVLPSALRTVWWSNQPGEGRLQCRLSVAPGATPRAGSFSAHLLTADGRPVASVEARYSGDPATLAVFRAAG